MYLLPGSAPPVACKVLKELAALSHAASSVIAAVACARSLFPLDSKPRLDVRFLRKWQEPLASRHCKRYNAGFVQAQPGEDMTLIEAKATLPRSSEQAFTACRRPFHPATAAGILKGGLL